MTIQSILQSLDNLNEIHVTLLEMGEQKRQVLIENKVQQLTQITNQEAKLMKQVASFEEQWLDHVAQFLREKGYEPNPKFTMTDLLQLVFNDEDKQALIAAQSKLLHTVDKLKEANAVNQQLIEQSLSYIEYTLDLLTEDPAQNVTYQNPSQQAKPKGNKGIFDTKA